MNYTKDNVELARMKRNALLNKWENKDLTSDFRTYFEDMTLANGYDLIACEIAPYLANNEGAKKAVIDNFQNN